MSNFSPNAILRGAQLTFIGTNRAVQNPNLFKHDHYRQALLAVAIGIAIQIVVSIPVLLVKGSIRFVGLFANLDAQTWDDVVVESLHFIQHSVLQIPFFLINLFKFMNPALDNMFMESLDWVDRTYLAKHSSDDPSGLRAMYYPNLRLWHANIKKPSAKDSLVHFLQRYGRKAAISITVLLLSYVPYIGKFVMPGLSFVYFRTAVGSKPAVAVFSSAIILPRRYVVRFLQMYFSSRTMMRELLHPYFSRVPYTADQKRRWFRDREGVLFGFGVVFFTLVKVPLMGVLVYGIAEASTAFLITKITEPPPPPPNDERERVQFVESQVSWRNKNKFLSLNVADWDALNVVTTPKARDPQEVEIPVKKYS